MVQFSRSLLSWLAASQTPFAGPSARSCSDSFITTAEGSLKVGEIFIRVEGDDSKLCRDDCSVLFREILSDEGNGVYRTAPASFSQVFPAGTYDSSYQGTAVESILPSCKDETLREGLTETKIARRLLEGDARKPDTYPKDDDKYVKDDDHDKDDDYYYKKSSCEKFYDATKKFIFDMYCIVRALDCTDYNPGQDDVYGDDDYKTKPPTKPPSKDEKDYRRRLQETPSMTSPRMRGVKGRSSRRRVEAVSTLSPAPSPTPSPAPTASPAPSPTPPPDAEVASLGGAEIEDATEGNLEVNPEIEGTTSAPGTVTGEIIKGGDTVAFEGESTKDSTKDSPKDSKEDDDHPADDFFDDDYHADSEIDSQKNFWKVMDTVFEYVESIWCIFERCPEDKPDDDYHKDDDDDDPKKDDKYKGKPYRRALLEIQGPPQYTSWSSAVGETSESLFQAVPTSFVDWMAVNPDGNCAYSKCTGVHSSEQCFTRQSLVVDTCRDSLEEWFALPAKGEDNVWSWNMDVACHGQDFCYASNVFAQTQCDEHFYRSLMQTCPDSSVTLSSNSALVTEDLYEHCPLVSILLYSTMKFKSDSLYLAARESQSVFESSGCN